MNEMAQEDGNAFGSVAVGVDLRVYHILYIYTSRFCTVFLSFSPTSIHLYTSDVISAAKMAAIASDMGAFAPEIGLHRLDY